jgi:putative oxidoreductase
MLQDLFSTNSDWTLTIIRIILGVVFFAHGAQKLLGWFGGPGLKETMRAMHDYLELPLPLAFAAVATEFFGGVALIIGLLSRVAAVGIGASMVAAIVMVHGRNGLFMDWFGARQKQGYEYHLLAIALALVLVAKGSGAFSLDRVLLNSMGV